MKGKFLKKELQKNKFIHTLDHEAFTCINSTFPKMPIRNQGEIERRKRRARAKKRISFCRRTLFTSACEFALKEGYR